MANPQDLTERSWCVLQYHSTRSVTRVQRAFGRNNQHGAPCNKTILKWYRQFVEQGYLCDKRKAHSGKRPLNVEIVEYVREKFVRSPRKSVRRASQELNIPKSTHRVSLR
ncbi:hypothetical protein C0J52_01800 [Blattella germanica]|nr:hypothetical protein C0J52_01800 [Blattella germanica]